jgi:Cu+-exporting ATPase
MPKTSFFSILWLLFFGLAVMFLGFATAATATGTFEAFRVLHVFGMHSALIFSMFSAIFSLLALSFSLNTQIGRPLTLFSAVVSALLLLVTTVLQLSGIHTAAADMPALAAAYIMTLRAFGVFSLPPRGDRSGLMEASWSLVLSGLAGGAWWLIDPGHVPAAAAACLLLSWPHLIDGINAFADKVFHRAAHAAGARDLTPGAFSKVAQARDIVIDKAAVMSGPDLIVTNVMAFNNEPKTLLAVAASAEAQSSHPVAIALRQLASQWHVAVKQPDRFEPTPGLGVVALLGGQTVVIGTTDLLKQLKIDSFTADAIARSLEADGKTVLRVAVGGRVVGVDAGVAGMSLRGEGLVPWLFTGDSQKTREALAGMLGLETLEDPNPGETAQEAASRTFQETPPLVLSLSQDRSSLELRDCAHIPADSSPEEQAPIAVSDTDDIGAFPALKALAMRRNLLAVHARRMLMGLWFLGGLGGALALAPLTTAPILFAVCLAILWGFARFSTADTLRKSLKIS